MMLAVDIIALALLVFLVIGFVRGLTRLSRNDNAGDSGDGYGNG
jgi:hypothetical protein